MTGIDGGVAQHEREDRTVRLKPRALAEPHPVGIELYVSRDEEYVSCTLLRGDHGVQLESRTHNGLLLVLARARLEDASLDLPESEQGWRYREDLASMLRIDGHLLNVWAHRARLQFGRAGMVDAARLIERRASVRQLRLGPSRIVIRRP